MAKAKVQFPKDAGECTTSDGTKYAPDKNGRAEVSSAHIAELAAFGIVLLSMGRDQTAEEAAADERRERLNKIADGNVGEVQKALDDLSDEDLLELEAIEQAKGEDKARKGVLGAIEAVKADRAEKAKE